MMNRAKRSFAIIAKVAAQIEGFADDYAFVIQGFSIFTRLRSMSSG